MKSTKKTIEIIFRWGAVIALIGICLCLCKYIHHWILADICLDSEHGVWDSNQNICRHDCLKWTEKEGCIPLDTTCDIYTDKDGCMLNNGDSF